MKNTIYTFLIFAVMTSSFAQSNWNSNGNSWEQGGWGTVGQGNYNVNYNWNISSSTNGQNQIAQSINVQDFGAIGDGNTDDYIAIQNAIDSASITGAKVNMPRGIYNISQTLIIPAGVMIEGEGRGATSTQTPYNGTIIKNIGTDVTISIIGQNAGLKDLVVYDTDNEGSVGGVEIVADGILIESVVLERVLIFGFTDGTALKLEAKNTGGISYCSFYDLRIRYGKTGILLEQDTTSFVNSNSFFHGAISGDGFDYCLRVLGGNNNVFDSFVFESYTAIYGHIVIESGQIIGNNVRIEGIFQPNDVPLIVINKGTSGTEISGRISGGMTIDKGDNYIDLKSDKSIDFKNSHYNQFMNSSFNGIVGNSIPFWEISGTGITVEVQDPEIIHTHNVIKLTIPPGVDGFLRQALKYTPKIMAPAKYDKVNFAAYIKTDKPNAITTICKAPAGIVTGGYHPGDSEWHMIGMRSLVNRTNPYDPKFHIINSNSSLPLEIYITTPTLAFGVATVELEAAPITENGGIITGTLTTSITTVSTDPSGFLVLSKNGNVFEVSGTNTTSRINHITADHFPKGTIITLLFNDANANIINSGYIRLVNSYTSIANGSLTLISMGNGTWREINRNQV